MTTPERVLITGGASGIGAATAARCRAEGWEPVIIDRVGNGIRADLSSPDDTARALAEALAGGPITRLVNNVGVVVPNDAEHQSCNSHAVLWCWRQRSGANVASCTARSGRRADRGHRWWRGHRRSCRWWGRWCRGRRWRWWCRRGVRWRCRL